MVQEQSNPGLSGYGTPSPRRSTGPLYQQVLTPQVPPETEMGTRLEDLLAGSAERGVAGGFIRQCIALHNFGSFLECIPKYILAD